MDKFLDLLTFTSEEIEENNKLVREYAINECINAIKNKWTLWHLGVVKAIIDVLEELKENDNDLA